MNATTQPLRRSEWLPDLGIATLFLTLAVATPGLALISLAFPAVRVRIARAFEILTRELYLDMRWPIALVVLSALINLVARHPFPPDDLARDLTVWNYGFDYRQMFWASPLIPSFNLYWAFDRLAGYAWSLPSEWRALPFQLVPLSILLVILIRVLHQTLNAQPHRNVLIAILLVSFLLMPGESTRILQGRPEVFFSAVLLSALVLPAWAWFALMIATAPLYWLSPIYSAGCLLLPGIPWRRRLAIGAFAAAFTSAEWLWITDLHWFEGFVSLAQAGRNRLDAVSETETVWKMLAFLPGPIAILFLWRSRDKISFAMDWDLLATMAIFLVPNQVRYTSVISPLVIILLARTFARHDPISGRTAYGLRLLAIWLSFFMVSAAFSGPKAPPQGFLAHVNTGDLILSPFEGTMYRSIYAAAPHGGRIAPAMEVGMTDQPIQILARDLHDGKIDCDALAREKIGWVVESGMKGAPPACLQFDSADGPNRAWRVVPSTGAHLEVEQPSKEPHSGESSPRPPLSVPTTERSPEVFGSDTRAQRGAGSPASAVNAS